MKSMGALQIKFPKSRIKFKSGGTLVVDHCKAALSKLRAISGDTITETDVDWIAKAFVFLCEVFGPDGLNALKTTTTLLRRGGPSQLSKIQIADGTTRIGSQAFIHVVRCIIRVTAVDGAEDYVMCKLMIEIADVWADIKTSIQSKDRAWSELLDKDEDVQTLKQGKTRRNNLAQGFGWLTLQTYPELKSEGIIDNKALGLSRMRLQDNVAAGEPLRVFEETFGDTVLLFLPGWKRIWADNSNFRPGRYELTRGIVHGVLLHECPDLPDILTNRWRCGTSPQCSIFVSCEQFRLSSSLRRSSA